MKRFEIVITAEHDKEVGDELMEAIYAIVRARDCRNLSTSVRTFTDKEQYHFDIPDFMRRPKVDGKEAGR